MMIKKSKPIRSKDHRTFVKSMECTIVNEDGVHCNGLPLDPHHLMKMGGRGMSRKENDNWIVPLCRCHHTEVTGYGDEEEFWVNYGFSYREIKDLAIEHARNSPCEIIFDSVEAMEEV
jgi:hypothetical protein